jgi:hypothetical protein
VCSSDLAVSFKPILDVLPKRSSMSSVTTTGVQDGDVVTNETITSNVAALIANVPKSSPNDPTTFIRPSSTTQIELARRGATLSEVIAADPEFARQIESVTPTDTIIPIRPI